MHLLSLRAPRSTHGSCATRGTVVVLLALAALAATRPAAAKDEPSRKPDNGCKWEKKSDVKLGLEAWVQSCDYGSRKIDFLFTDGALAQRYSDGGKAEPVVDVFALEAGESVDAGLKRIFAAHTEKSVAARCVLKPYHGKASSGVERFVFVPDAAYAKELKKKASPDEVPEPPCGDFGESADGIAYFEAQPKSGAKKVLYVVIGQDQPLFDERTLRLLPP